MFWYCHYLKNELSPDPFHSSNYQKPSFSLFCFVEPAPLVAGLLATIDSVMLLHYSVKTHLQKAKQYPLVIQEVFFNDSLNSSCCFVLASG